MPARLVSLNPLIRDVVEQVRFFRQESAVFCLDLWSESPIICGCEEEVRQVLMHLLLNYLDSAPSIGMVQISGEDRDAHVTVQINSPDYPDSVGSSVTFSAGLLTSL